MKIPTRLFLLRAALAPAMLFLAGCEGVDSGSVSYGYSSGFNDPWYYGGAWDDPIYIAGPPDRPGPPGGGSIGGPHPSHPIARPPMSAPRPMPSIPSAPRVAPRR